MTVYIKGIAMPALHKAITKASRHIPGITVQCEPERTLTVSVYELVEGERGALVPTLMHTYPIEAHEVTITLPELQGTGCRVIARRYINPEGNPETEWYGTERVELLTDTHTCEHCNTTRRRTESFVVRMPDGGIKQVGGDCRGYYIPTALLRMLKAWAECLTKMQGWMVDGERIATGAPRTDCFPVCQALAWLLADLKVNTFVPSRNTYGEPDHYATWRVMHRAIDATGELKAVQWTPELSELVRDLRAEDIDNICPGVENDYITVRNLSRLSGAVVRWLRQQMEAKTPAVEQVMPPEGRVNIEGTVLSVKAIETDFGTTTKMLVDVGAYRVWGTVPSSICPAIGWRVKFTAAITPREVGFGFYSRPTKAQSFEPVEQVA
jgi:hypothetical protein